MKTKCTQTHDQTLNVRSTYKYFLYIKYTFSILFQLKSTVVKDSPYNIPNHSLIL